jgi:hypothetical protein
LAIGFAFAYSACQFHRDSWLEEAFVYWRGGLLGLMIIVSVPLTISPTTALAEPKVGVASATKNQVQGVVRGTSREIGAGSEVFSNELVRTGADSLAQLLFLDQTNLSVGPQSEVKLDRFVYNPSRGGRVVIETGRGAFRFITGSQNSASYTIKTPLATIGVRGTTFDLVTRINSTNNKKVIEEIIVLVEGAISIRTRDGQSHDLVKPGTAFMLTDASGPVTVNGPGTWDGTIYDVPGGVPFPLYGSNLFLDPRYKQAPDSRPPI